MDNTSDRQSAWWATTACGRTDIPYCMLHSGSAIVRKNFRRPTLRVCTRSFCLALSEGIVTNGCWSLRIVHICCIVFSAQTRNCNTSVMNSTGLP